ncbi:MAG TPA: zinc-binding alcohol dehydrogenase [Rariglobus sp.]|nr:zinc-binding alcohol dehydrogenase [Rariglobus sp.]
MTPTPILGRRVVFPAANQVEIEHFTPPAPAAGEILVETITSLLSTGTETIAFGRKFEASTHWDNWVRYPFYPGYSSVGTVLAVGAEVSQHKIGDRVAYRIGHRSHHVLKAELCYSVPKEIDPQDAVWFALAKIAGHGVRAAGITLGDAVVVIGAGPIGQMALRWSLACGAGKVLCIDLAEERLKMAKSAGAIPILASHGNVLESVTLALGGNRPPVVIDSTGNAEVIKTAFSLAANKGLVVLLGDTGSPGSQTLTSDVIIRGLRLVGSHDGHNAPEWNNPVSAGHFFTFLRDGRFSVKNLNTHFFKPEACKEAYTLASEDRLRTMGILFDWASPSLES